jgi:hypothetical protein
MTTTELKKQDRVQVRTTTGRFHGEFGTITAVSFWVFGRPEDICYLVELDSGTAVTCDAQDLELVTP